MSDNVVDLETLGNIHRKILVDEDFSQDINQRYEEKQQILDIISEPLRRLEFNILLYICDQTYKPYDKIKLDTEVGKNKHTTYYVSCPKEEIESLIEVLSDPNISTNMLTLDYVFNRTRIIFRHKEYFDSFSDSKMMNQSKMYGKLFGITVDTPIKVLYYFLSHYKYDFIDTVMKCTKVYNCISAMDDYFCEQGYHKRLI